MAEFEIYEFEGTTYKVSPEKLDAFKDKYPEATKVDTEEEEVETPEVETPEIEIPEVETPDFGVYEFDGTTYKVSDSKLDAFKLKYPEAEKVETEETPKLEITHPTVEAFKSAEGEGFIDSFRKEENITNFLNDYYTENFPEHNIRFRQSKAGRDALEVVIGEGDDWEEFDLSGFRGLNLAKRLTGAGREYAIPNEEVFETIKTHIDMKLNSSLQDDIADELLNYVDEEDLVWDNKAEYKLEFLNKIDAVQGGEPTEWQHGAFTTDSRLAYHTDEVHQITGSKMHVSGGITVTDDEGVSRFISNKYLWDNRDRFANIIGEKRKQEIKDNDISEYGEGYVKTDKDSPLGLEFGGNYNQIRNQGVDQWNFVTNGDKKKNIVDLADKISQLKKDPSQEIFYKKYLQKTGGGKGIMGRFRKGEREVSRGAKGEQGIKDMEAEFKRLVDELGIKPIYHADGPEKGFIDITRTLELVNEPTEFEAKIKDDANILAGENSIVALSEMVEDAYYDYLHAANIAHKNIDEIYKETPWLQELAQKEFGKGGMSPKELRRIFEQGNFEGAFIDQLPGNSNAARNFNDAQAKFLTLSQALFMNADLSQNKQETFIQEVVSDLSESFTGERIFQPSLTLDKETEVFNRAMTESGFKIPDTIEGKEHLRRNASNVRRYTEGATQVITDMAPLLLELYGFGKIGATKKIHQGVKAFGTWITKGSKIPKIINKPLTGLMNTVIVPGVATTAEWAMAETAGEKMFGWQAQTIDWKTGETRFTFPFAMGASGTVFKQLSNTIYRNLIKQPGTGRVIGRLNTITPESRAFKRIFGPTVGTGSRVVGQGATATMLLTVAEFFQEEINALTKEGRPATAKELSHLLDKEHLLNTFAAMTILSGRKMVPQVRESIRQGVAGLNKNTLASQKSAKNLKLDKSSQGKDGRYHVSSLVHGKKSIQTAVEARRKEIKKEESDNIKKEIKKTKDLNVRKKNIKKIREKSKSKTEKLFDDVKTLRIHNRVIQEGKAARAEGKYNDYLWKLSKNMDNIQRVGLMSDAEREEMSKLDHGDIEKMLYMKGFKPGDGNFEFFSGYHDILRHYTQMADGGVIRIGDQTFKVPELTGAERKIYIENSIKQFLNEHKIKSLEKEIESNKDDSSIKVRNQSRIKKLKELNKNLEEKVTEAENKHEERTKQMLKIELEVSKEIAKEFGVKKENFQVLKDAEFQKALEKYGKGNEVTAEAFYDRKNNKIYINFDKALEMRSMGVGIHEVVHHILKGSFKTTKTVNGKSYQVASKKGMEVINSFLDRLHPEARKWVEKHVENNYKFERFSKEKYEALQEYVKELKKKDKKKLTDAEKDVLFEWSTHKGEAKRLSDGRYEVEIKEEYYYEEYVTAYSQGLKEGKIKYRENTTRKLGKLFYPIIKGAAFPKLYEIEGIDSQQAGKDLHNLLKDLHATSERMKIKKLKGEEIKVSEKLKKQRAAIRERISKGDGIVFSKKYEFGSERVNEELGLKDKTKNIVKENERLYGEVLKTAKAAGVKTTTIEYKGKKIEVIEDAKVDGKEFVSQNIRDALIINNMPRVAALAKKAATRPADIGLEERLRVSYEEFYSDYTLKLVELSRTWDPVKNPSFGAYMNTILPKKYSGILEKLKEKIPTKSITDPAVGKKIAEKEFKESEEKIIKQKSKLKEFILKRNKLAKTKDSKGEILSSAELTNKIRHAVTSAFRTAGDIRATIKGKPRLFLDNLEKSFVTDLSTDIKKSFGTRKIYEDFINNSFATIKHITQTERGLGLLVRAEMDFAYKPVIDAKTGKQARMTVDEMFEAGYPLGKVGDQYKKIKEDKKLTKEERNKKLKKLDKTRSGPPKWEIDLKNFTETNYKNWAKAKGMSISAKGTRKDALARIFSVELAKDAVPTAINNPYQKAWDVKGNPKIGKGGRQATVDVLKELSLQQKTNVAAELLKAQVLDVINRDPGLSFSKKKELKDFEKTQSGFSIAERIESVERKENAEIKKTLDNASMKLYGKNYIDSLRGLEEKLFEQDALHKLVDREAENILSGKELEHLKILEEIAITNTSVVKVVEKFNKDNPGAKIPYDGHRFAFDAKTNSLSSKGKKFLKHQGGAFMSLPKVFFTNKKLLNKLIETGGQGSLITRKRFKDGKFKDGVLLKPQASKTSTRNENHSKIYWKKNIKNLGITADIPTIKTKNKKGETIEVPITDAFKIVNISGYKKELKDFYEKNGKKKNYEDLLTEWSRKRLTAKGFTYEQTYAANKWVREQLMKALNSYVLEAKTPKQFSDRADFFHKFLQIQTNIGEGLIKGLNTVRYMTLEAPTRNATYSGSKASGYHAEHAFFNLAHTATASALLSKYRKNKDIKALTEEYNILSSKLEQFIISDALRSKNEGKQPTGEVLGNTEFFKNGNIHPILNVLTSNPTAAFKIVDIYNKENLGKRISRNVNLGTTEGAMFVRTLGEAIVPIINNTKAPKTPVDIAFSKKGTKHMTFQDKINAVKSIDKAVRKGRSLEQEKRGISVWDLDDTLVKSKSGVRYTLPNPAGTPQPGRKVIFLAGGPGAGKSNVVKQLMLEQQGFKIVNQDISLQWLAKNHGLPKDMRDFTSKQASKWGELTWDARMIAKRKQTKFQGRGDGVVVDGTGNSLQTMRNQVQEFKNKGYDVQMVFVETSKNIAVERNRIRKERSLKTSIVERTWDNVMNNKLPFKLLFGENFVEIKTDKLKQGESLPADVTAKLDKFTKSYKKGRLDPGEFAGRGAELEARGAKFDFTEFDYVKQGEKGPFWQKAMDRIEKFGNKDNFILTARPPAAQKPIYMFLQSRGLNIPLKNITALGNSTAQAKALWMLEKFSEGYNDFYFADDAIKNVKEVKNVLEQLDVKHKVQQAVQFSKKNLSPEVNKIMEQSLKIDANKKFSKVEAKVRGKNIKRRRFFMEDSIADLELLVEPLYGKGKQGIKNKEWFKQNFFRPLERGFNDLNNKRQTTSNDYHTLRKANKDVVKSLDKPVEKGAGFTNDMAVRVYLWNKAGVKIPDLTKQTEKKLVDHVKNNPKLQAYAESVGKITKLETGLKEPSDAWWAETIATNIRDIGIGKSGRKQFLQDFIERKNEIFSEENLNKMESKLGSNWREIIEDMFSRIETGRTKSERMTKGSQQVLNYINGSVGAIMNLNTRSGILQLISSVNFINHSFNNPLKIAQTLANPKQYVKDFMFIMNSNMLKQRRAGLKINVNEAELAAAVATAKNPFDRALSYILSKGYLPTKIADSFAIASGGASFYRNAVKKYTKEGLSKTQAEKKAWLDFQAMAERAQQSSRADLLSRQQTTLAGKIILPFANTPIQYNRIMAKEIFDIAKGRYKGWFGENSFTHKVSKVLYYGAIQNVIFAGLQSALFAVMFGSDDEPLIAEKKTRTVNTVADSFLRGMGIKGAVVAGVKNAFLKFFQENKKDYRADYSEVAEQLLNISPPIGAKFSKLDAAGNTYKYNKKQILDEGFVFGLNSPSLEASTQVVEAITNVPINRVYKKVHNINNSLNSDYEAWQRAMMFGGWSDWDVGIKTVKTPYRLQETKSSRPRL